MLTPTVVGMLLPPIWGQASPGLAPSSPGQEAADLAASALRRWLADRTLASSSVVPGWDGMIALIVGLAGLFLLAMVAAGPGKTLRQVFDLPGNVRLIGRAIARLQGSARLIAAVLGATVVLWSAHQILTYRQDERLDELAVLRKVRTAGEMASDQGTLAALTPLRDVIGLGDNALLLLFAAILVFRASARRWSDPSPRQRGPSSGPLPPWTTLCWGGLWVLLLYRRAMSLAARNGLPSFGCLIVEAPIVPSLMLMADGLLLAWVLVELRSSGLGAYDNDGLDVAGSLELLPGAMLAGLLGLPGYYAALGTWLLALQIPDFVGASGLAWLVNSRAIIAMQAVAWLFLGLPGAVAWSRGGMAGALRGYGRLLRAEGGRLVAVGVFAAAFAGGLSALAYLVLMTFPTSSWLLTTADAYAHYLSLPVGLVTLSAVVELAERSLPTAVEADETVGKIAVVEVVTG